MNQISKESKSVADFIELVLIEKIGELVSSGNHYLGIGPQTQAIELLGAIIEDENVESNIFKSESEFGTTRKSRKRFHNALKLFSNKKYVDYCPESFRDGTFMKDYDLYENLRCGYAHQMRPLGRISITTEKESYNDGTFHLEIEKQTNELIIVSEFLYRDLKQTCEIVISMIKSGKINHTKPYGPFLEIIEFPRS